MDEDEEDTFDDDNISQVGIGTQAWSVVCHQVKIPVTIWWVLKPPPVLRGILRSLEINTGILCDVDI